MLVAAGESSTKADKIKENDDRGRWKKVEKVGFYKRYRTGNRKVSG